VKVKKVVAHKDERIRKIAYNLRSLLKNLVLDKDVALNEDWEREYWEMGNKKKARIIQSQKEELYNALDKSICRCPDCKRSDRDMVFNPAIQEWWCTQCYREMGEYYCKKKEILDKGGFVGDFNEKYYKTFTI